MTTVCWIDGQPAQGLPLTDRGLHYGDGLFETLAVKDGRILRLGMHLERLSEGCSRLGLPAPDGRQLQQELDVAAQGQAKAVLKLMVTRGSGGRGYRPPVAAHATRVLLRYPWPDHPAAWAEQGIELRICRTRLGLNPDLAGLKHLNRLEQVLARAEWSEGPQEGLMLDTEDRVIEGTMTNVFGSPEPGELVTPDLRRAGVAGVMRRHILEQARQAGVKVAVRDISLAELMEQREIFVCNSIAGIWPVCRIDTRSYRLGSMTQMARQWAGQD